jgi:CDP-diacylglycerol--serine O-phosphatidyltransferase
MIKISPKHFHNSLSFFKLLPNLLTLTALTIGLNSIKMALEGKWEKAVFCIIIAAIIDGLDGKLARLLNATSVFGAELDSLCDFVNFGICPVLITYLWLHSMTSVAFLWSATVIYAICMVIRLARFNTNLSNPDKVLKSFFIGVPAPAGAILCLLPLILSFEIAKDFKINISNYIYFIPFYIMCIGFLLACRIPTFSLKHIQIKKEYVWIVMLVFAIIIIEVLLYPWYWLPLLNLIYLCSIPISFKRSRLMTQQNKIAKLNDAS